MNGMQTNGTLLNEDWCRFLAAEGLPWASVWTARRRCTTVTVSPGSRSHARAGDARLSAPAAAQGPFRHPLCGPCRQCPHPSRSIGFSSSSRPLRGIFTSRRTAGRRCRRRSSRSVPPEAFGNFLCTIFDEWVREDIGRIKVQIFEETAGTAFGREQALCIFRKTCGDVAVIEHNGDFFSCDHFVDPEHRLGNIRETPWRRLWTVRSKGPLVRPNPQNSPLLPGMRGPGNVPWRLSQGPHRPHT